MKTLVIGSAGQLGSELLRVLPGDVVGLTRAELDVTDRDAVEECIEAHEPDWVVNTAAFHRVDDCEADPGTAEAVNIRGAANVARACARVDVCHAWVSTDYVFGGETDRRTPYREDDDTHPVNYYGETKEAGELEVRAYHPHPLIIRTAGLYGSHSGKGWTFPLLMLKKAANGEPVRVVNDQVLSPTFTRDLAYGIRDLMQHGATGIHHITNSGECSWYDFANAVYVLTGTNANLQPQTTAQSGAKARRPSYSALATARGTPLRHWREALADYLSNLVAE